MTTHDLVTGILIDLHQHAQRWKQPEESEEAFLADHLFHLRLMSRKKFGSFRLRPRPVHAQFTPDLIHCDNFKMLWEDQLLGSRFHKKKDRQGLCYAFEERPGEKTGAGVCTDQSHVHGVLLSPNHIDALKESLKKFELKRPPYDSIDIKLEPMTTTPEQLVRYVAKSYLNGVRSWGHADAVSLQQDLWERYP